MILICPACSTRYEVARLALPDSGREMVCNACGHAWLHLPQAGAAHPAPAPQTEDAQAGQDAPARMSEPPASAIPTAPRLTSVAAAIPPEVLAFLREEAARRTALQAAAPEVVPEAAPEAPSPALVAAAGASARTGDAPVSLSNSTTVGAPDDSAVAAPGGLGQPAGVLWRAATPEPAAPTEASGAGRGVMVLALALTLAGALYLAAPTLARMLPALGPALGGYQSAVQALGDWALGDWALARRP